MDKKYSVDIEGQKVEINFVGAAMRSMKEMCLNEYPVYGTILALGPELLKMKDQQQFIIIDEYQRLGIVGVKDTNTMAIDIIAVVPQANVYIKRTAKVFIYGEDKIDT